MAIETKHCTAPCAPVAPAPLTMPPCQGCSLT